MPVVVGEGDFPVLQKLSLHCFAGERLMRLAPLFCTSITELSLVETNETPLSTLLKRLPQLRALMVCRGNVGSIVSLLTGRLRHLTSLIMADTGLEDRHARSFSRLQELRLLELSDNQRITERFLRPLTGLTRLSRLSLKWCHGVLPAAVPFFCARIDAARAAYGWPPLEVVGLATIIPMDEQWDSDSEGVEQHEPWDVFFGGTNPASET